MHFPQIEHAAPAASPLGMLQRGRGSGWSEAAASDSGAELLLACLAHEPRWDRQVESRADYYASLALHLAVPVDALAACANGDDDEWIVDEVIEAMARRGSVEAALLRRATPDAADVNHCEPERADRGTRSPMSSMTSVDASIEDLLGAPWTGAFPKAVVHRLRTTSDQTEVDALRRVAREVEHPGWRLAVHVLSRRGDISALDVVERVLETDESGPARATAYRFVTALPSAVSLPLARSWLSHTDGRGAVASAVFAKHAEVEDAPAVRAALAVADDYYTMTSLAHALGRLAEVGPFPELDEIYLHSAYSYARARAVQAMATTDSAFAERRAMECLWDCEESVRVQGALLAPMEQAALDRLRQLAADELEDPDVRAAARARLG
ncbi:hypothetical protein [Nocardioides nitrophenolicus]|uniref:hypothetical protein n=1 Tax=Nocardioides nitrophenolicus TaxID=60489 RepID=UPI00195DF892|nr:hypothetical protein [Nocardioides nitrophenolicus]MBM7519800.1 hypothetical protein [Nocardioides nitrophenolicus]